LFQQQQQVAQAIDRAKQITLADLNQVIGVSRMLFQYFYFLVPFRVGPMLRSGEHRPKNTVFCLNKMVSCLSAYTLSFTQGGYRVFRSSTHLSSPLKSTKIYPGMSKIPTIILVVHLW